MQKYTIIWEDRWQSGSHHHCITKKTWVECNSIEDLMREYSDYARFIFEGHILTLGEEFDQILVDTIV
jgi:hypothetical protein